MVSKEQLRLGLEVLYGDEKKVGVVDGITWTWVGLKLKDGGYVIADWEEIELCG